MAALTPESIILKGPPLKDHEISLLYDFVMEHHGGLLYRRPGMKVLSLSLPDIGSSIIGRKCSLLCDLLCIEGNLIAIGGRLGKGTRGSVFSSFNLTQGIRTAVKKIDGVIFPGTDDDLNARVKRQISLTKNMSSQRRQVLGPFIVKSVEDSLEGVCHVSYLFSMPIAIGSILKFMKEGALNFTRMMRSLLRQLNVLHTSHGFAHMDVKVDNVLVTEEGHIFLADYGEARPIGSLIEPFIGFMRENHPHMPPEIFAPQGARSSPDPIVVDHSIDIFSLGYMIRTIMKFLEIPESRNFEVLLNAMLSTDPRSRPTPVQALNYPLP